MKKLRINSKIKFIIVAVVFYIVVANFSLFLPIFNNLNQISSDSNKNFPNSSSSVDDFEYSWNASWGGLYYDAATDVATDSQNNVYFTGRSELTGSEDYAIILSKHDTNGQEEWVKMWDGSSFEEAQDIFIDSANNIFIIGSTNSLGEPNGDVLIIKYDTAGNEIWNKTWGGIEQDRGFGINEDIYGNYYITGYTNSFGDVDGDVFLIKYNNQFEEQWNVIWGGSEIDIAYNVDFDSNNYVYIAGHSESLDPDPAQSDVFLLKYNSSGDLEWQREWTQSLTQRGRGLAIDSNDNIYITGYTFGHPAGSGKGFILKYNSLGTFQWDKLWGFSGEVGNYMYNIIIDDNDDLYISGATKYYGIYGNYDSILLNYDTSGNLNWYKLWITNGADLIAGICKDSIGNIYLAGATDYDTAGENDMLLIKYMNTIAPEIAIITPENKTYTGPMNGYYPATYGFENELDGTSRTNITYVDGTNLIHSNCEVEIVNNYQGHNKVLRVYDGNTNGNAGAEHHFNSIQTTGTVEWWWLSPDISDNRMWIHFHQDQIGILAFSLGAIDDEFRQSNGTVVQTYNLNQWYHHKVSFDTISNTYDWYIDGLMVVNGGTLENPVSHVGSTHIKGAWTTTGESYFDAFGFSWISNYSVGDNLDEGLLLSYETIASLDWQSYSLDGQSNKTIIGNTTIPMPSEDQHRIQVFGNDILGTMYHSNVHYFSIKYKEITLITPEAKVYTGPMSGYYAASFGFENEAVGASGSSIDFVDYDNCSLDCTVSIVSEISGHKNVLDAYNGNSEGGVSISDYFESPKQFGTMEWWWRAQDAVKGSGLGLINGSAYGPRLNINYGEIRYYDGSYHRIMDAYDDVWYHLRLDFECSSGGYEGLSANTFYVYINGNRYGPYPFHNNITCIDHLGIWSSTRNYGYHSYLDAISYSWDPNNYIIGDNMNEGLLLSYENDISLDWIGYSLDGQANITITGAKVIPLPEIGTHSLILNGITSEGMVIQSEERFFSILIPDPPPPPPPPIIPNNPYLIPIFLTSIALGIITSLGITLFLLVKKRSPRTSFIINSPVERSSTPKIENIDLSSKQIRFCPICGATADNTYQFCANCGASFKDI